MRQEQIKCAAIIKKMRRLFKISVTAVFLAILLFVAGKWLFVYLFGFFEPTVNGISFQITERPGIIKTSTLFACTLVLMPAITAMIIRFAPIVSTGSKIAALATIVVFAAVTIFIRHAEVKSYFNYLVKNKNLLNGKPSIIYPIDPVNFVYYMMAGFFAGCVVAFFLFRRRKTKTTRQTGKQQ